MALARIFSNLWLAAIQKDVVKCLSLSSYVFSHFACGWGATLWLYIVFNVHIYITVYICKCALLQSLQRKNSIGKGLSPDLERQLDELSGKGGTSLVIALIVPFIFFIWFLITAISHWHL